MVGERKFEVCRKAFMSLLAVGEKTVRRLQKDILLDKSPGDNRGKQQNQKTIPITTVMQLTYVRKEVSSNINELYIYSDNAAGQNKNDAMFWFLMARLADMGHFLRVVYRQSIRGHSYQPNDRDFGTVKRSLNKVDRHYTVRDVIEIIAKASHKFRVRFVRNEDILNFQTCCFTMYKRSPVSEESQVHRLKNSKNGNREVFAISTYHEFIWTKGRKG
ncbi:hypothetical protein ANN_02618 [Periplaneta americana]|uniref:DUF7869 domain-containing protein n=1 Tax=Periplaneta americana TaxID=6978 RepID=A0ABQ8TYH5_PERAM|nr:hypothetical protein ANN_02618 [Periplaneta americana]